MLVIKLLKVDYGQVSFRLEKDLSNQGPIGLYFLGFIQKDPIIDNLKCMAPIYYSSPQSFIFRCLNIFGDFYWIFVVLVIKLGVQKFQPLILIYRIERLVMFIIIGDVHCTSQFISHCLIPLDPCVKCKIPVKKVAA